MSPTTAARSTVSSSRRLVRDHPDRCEDGVDEAVEPLDLLERARVPPRAAGAPLRVARRAVRERRLVREQVRVGAHDRERRAQLVGHERDELRPGPIERDELLDLRLGLGLEAALLDDAREQVRDRGQLRDVRVAELAVRLGLDVEHADDLVVPGERHGQHRGDEPALVDAADPQEAVVLADVGDDERLAHRGDPAGDPLAEGHVARPIW